MRGTRTSRVRVADVLTRHGGREFGVLNFEFTNNVQEIFNSLTTVCSGNVPVVT